MPQISITCNSNGSGAPYRDNGGGAGNESWATIRSGAGNAVVTDEIPVYNQYDDGLWQQLARGIFQFNLNDPLLSGATINAITFRLRVSGNPTTHTRGLILRIVSATPASNTSLANSDYAQVSSTAQCDTDVALADLIPAADNDFTGNSAMVALAQTAAGTGYLSIGARYTADINNSAPSQDAGFFSTVAFDKANTKVIITYTAATTTSTTTSTSTTVTTTSTSTTSTSTSTTRTTTSTSTTSTSTSTTSTSTTSTSTSTTSTSTTTTLAYVYSVEEAT